MAWTVLYHDAFASELAGFPAAVQDALLAMAELLIAFGPNLARQHADTLGGSKHANMKELRFRAAGGVWRAAFAFDPKRRAIILVAGDKAGIVQQRFYRGLITRADARFTEHLASLED